jgi:hypothetical protein
MLQRTFRGYIRGHSEDILEDIQMIFRGHSEDIRRPFKEYYRGRLEDIFYDI